MAKESIKFYEDRTFGDLIGAPFQFVIQEFKNLFLTILKYSSPFLLLALVFFVLGYRDVSYSIFQNNYPGPYMILGIISGYLAVLAMTVTFYSYVVLYSKMGRGNFTINDVGELLKKYVFKVFGGMLLMAVMIFPLSFLAIIPFIGFLIFYGAFFYLYVSLSFFMIVIVNEDATVGTSFSRSFELIKGKWWFAFGIYLVFGLIVAFASYIILIPIVLIFGFSFAGFGGGAVVIVLSIIIYIALYLVIISLHHSLVSFVYFKIKFLKEGPDLMDRIEEINKEENDQISSDNDNVNLGDEQEDEEDKNRFDGDDFNRFKPKF